MTDKLKARVEALEIALVGLVEALGSQARPVLTILEFTARETAKGRSETPEIAKAAAALLKRLK